MLTSLSLDQLDFVIADRRADAKHAALVHEAASAHARPAQPRAPLRARVAATLRTLACRLDPALA